MINALTKSQEEILKATINNTRIRNLKILNSEHVIQILFKL
jgi:hypothetical protein